MNTSKALLVALALAVGGGRAQANTMITFPVGSIIIPSSSVFQSDCGAVSMYGLAYDVLRANKWLIANGYGAITLYYAVADGTATSWSPGGKLSPNRCKPTNASVAPAPATDASWNDGCDFQLTSATGTPVKLVSNVATASTSDTVVTTYSTTSKTTVYPTYAAIALNANVTTVGYLGGPLVITATDAVTFLKLVQGTLVAKDTAGNNIDFTPFRTTKPAASGACTFGVDHYVNLHRAQVAFNASIVKSFSDTPPRLALLDSDNTHVTGVVKSSNATALTIAATAGATESGLTATFTTTAAHGFAIGNQVTVSGVPVAGYNGTFTVLTVPSTTKFTATMSVSNLASSAGGSVILAGGSILIGYLNNAGLTFAGSQGCPTGGQNVGNLALCPLAGNAGQIYDTFDMVDLKNNKLTIADSGIPRYSMIWTPHWETTANATTAPNTTERTALTNIKSFLDGQTGLLGECAAITTYEGSYQGGAAKVIGSPTAYGGMQLQTCVNSGGNCSTTTTNFGTDRNVTGAPSGSALRNCSDVTTAAGAACVYYGYPQDPFAQLGDYEFIPKTGTTQDFHPNTATTTMYRPGVLALISGVNVLDKTKLTTPATARAMIVTDWSTRNIKDNTPGKANIAYLGGHDLTGEVSGTKLVLETLLQLGSSVVVLPTSTIEVSRATPIVANIDGGQTVVQGTFESVTPAPAVTTINAAGDVAAWSFPYQIGHMRATVSSTISVNAAKFGTGTVLFDAAAGIPSVSNSGCSTPFTGGCRTVFTTTTVSATGVTRNPANVFFQDSNATALGTLMAPGLAAAQWKVMVEKVLAGHSDGNGNFVARLGGVDRSSVAIIEPSSVIPNGRPTIAYFGATDGMIHAVCASLTAPCDTLGRELWAFVPRTQLPFFRTNTTRIDGSPHVADVFGDFTNSGTKSFHTILTFQTGSGNVTVAGATPAVYSLDITDPTHPSVVWEYTIANPSARGTYELGSGLATASGPTTSALTRTNLGVRRDQQRWHRGRRRRGHRDERRDRRQALAVRLHVSVAAREQRPRGARERHPGRCGRRRQDHAGLRHRRRLRRSVRRPVGGRSDDRHEPVSQQAAVPVLDRLPPDRRDARDLQRRQEAVRGDRHRWLRRSRRHYVGHRDAGGGRGVAQRAGRRSDAEPAVRTARRAVHVLARRRSAHVRAAADRRRPAVRHHGLGGRQHDRLWHQRCHRPPDLVHAGDRRLEHRRRHRRCRHGRQCRHHALHRVEHPAATDSTSALTTTGESVDGQAKPQYTKQLFLRRI